MWLLLPLLATGCGKADDDQARDLANQEDFPCTGELVTHTHRDPSFFVDRWGRRMALVDGRVWIGAHFHTTRSEAELAALDVSVDGIEPVGEYDLLPDELVGFDVEGTTLVGLATERDDEGPSHPVIIDLSGDDPTLTATLGGDYYSSNPSIVDETAFLAAVDDPYVPVFDVSDPSDPIQVAGLSLLASAVVSDGTWVTAVRRFDGDDEVQMHELGRFITPGFPGAPIPGDMIDLADASSAPVVLSVVEDGRLLLSLPERDYTYAFHGTWSIDTTNTIANFSTISTDGDIVFLFAEVDYFEIHVLMLDVSDPTSPELVGGWSHPDISPHHGVVDEDGVLWFLGYDGLEQEDGLFGLDIDACR